MQAASSPEELRDCQLKVPVFVKALLDSGARVESITRIMATASDGALVRLIAMAEAELGPPPVPYSFVVMGSAARGEQTLATDQDNAIIYADVAEDEDEQTQGYFLRLGERVCGWLDEVGFRRCKGDTMASSPAWCLPLSRWRAFFTDCVTVSSPQDLLKVNIAFDLRCAFGEADHVTQLRQHVRALLEGGAPAFFFHLAQSTLQFKPPVGFFGNIQLEPSSKSPSTFNIKSAIIPLVNFARMYALREQLVETNTIDRLDRLRDAGVLKPSSHDELVQAYTALMQMRLNHQARQWSQGTPPDNSIDLSELTQLDRSILRRVFADIAVFQARLQADFARIA
jgi:CBS domain-containing protein